MLKIIAPKNEKRLPQFVAEADMETLLAHVEFPDNWQGQTERLVLHLFYNTGMRLSELVQLKKQNISLASRSIKVLGKGNKERILPVSPELLQQVKDYLALRETEGFAGNEILLLNGKGKPFGPRKIYTIVNKYLSLVTTIQKRSPHVLRHSFATHLMDHGANLNAVKELLGHSSLAATQVYTHNSIEKLKNVHRQAHPKA
jgi:integrase/recombinase XerC